MQKQMKIVVVDSSGCERIFNENEENEIYLELIVRDKKSEIIEGMIEVKTRVFEDGTCVNTVFDYFPNPRSITVLWK